MDPITHGLIGAAASSPLTDREKTRPAAFLGFVSAMLPDLDVLIGHSADPLLNLEYHRQFTHALVFIPPGALMASGLLWWFVRNKLSFKETYLFCLLGYATAGLADTFTSYGVQLLWPFTGERFAWNIISVFDPLFSLGLVLAVALAFYHRKKRFIGIAFGWISLYLLFGLIQRERAEDLACTLAEQRHHPVQQLIAKPTIANELLWSIRYVSGDSLYAYGARLLPFAEPVVYEGEAAALLPWQQQFGHIKSTTLFRDIERFSALSDGILTTHPNHDNVIGDGRYSMLPTSVKPLWGIEVDTAKADQHVDFKTYRDAGTEVREAFMEMLLGRPAK
ncbi:inner membrane protein [Fodinibius roseus]|uniref:Inner membrane protein n=1 Tax=Fodinibius roseus TaxID=1194090 RepID=A0A1M5DHK7_9BACT|nr:metal-dependent hydrolase [Fodinibius roseus]SHF66364.1 inner membrane protein [Fodinibius roseus]